MNSNEHWELEIRNTVYKQLAKFPSKDKEKIVGIMQELPYNPYFGDIEKIVGEKNQWRRRIGSYRLFYEILPKEKIIYIFWVERRTSKTYR